MTTIMPRARTIRRFDLEGVVTTRTSTNDVQIVLCDDCIHLTSHEHTSDQTDRFKVSLLQKLLALPGGAFHQFLFDISQSTLRSDRLVETTVDAHVHGALMGVAIGRRITQSLELDGASMSGSIELWQSRLSSTREILGRLDEANKSKDAPLVEAYSSLSRILTTQKKKGWAEALFVNVKQLLTEGPQNTYQRTLAKLTPDQLDQFLTDVRSTLAVTKGFEHKADLIARYELRAKHPEINPAIIDVLSKAVAEVS